MSFKSFEFLCVSDDSFVNWIGEMSLEMKFVFISSYSKMADAENTVSHVPE